LKENHTVKSLCKIFRLNRSSYYKWLRSKEGAAGARRQETEHILCEMRRIHAEHNRTYGYRRLADEYNSEHGTHYSYKRFYRLAHEYRIYSVIRRKRPQWRPSTPEITAENILNREFRADRAANSVWLTDVTEMKYFSNHRKDTEKLYLSAIFDLKTRDIVAHTISDRNDNALVLTNFEQARNKYPDARPMFHSDRGYQYTSKAFRRKLDEAGMTQSMSRVGRCIDNGPMEGFWGILKSEMYYLRKFESKEQLTQAINDFIDYYNTRRRQHNLDCLPPAQYRMMLEQKELQAARGQQNG